MIYFLKRSIVSGVIGPMENVLSSVEKVQKIKVELYLKLREMEDLVLETHRSWKNATTLLVVNDLVQCSIVRIV